MTRNRIAYSVALSAGLLFLIAVPVQVRADSAPHAAVQAPKSVSQATQSNANPYPDSDFAGLDLSSEQKAGIAKIHQDAEARKTVVANDDKLSGDQKDAMILGYMRLEYGSIFRILTPVQQKLVRKRMQERRAADQAAQKKQAPGPVPPH